MKRTNAPFHEVTASLEDLVGAQYALAVCRARAALTGEDLDPLLAIARDPVDFFPASLQSRLHDLLPLVGEKIAPGQERSAAGATTTKFQEATRPGMAPLSGLGVFRVGEDGRLFLITKSEHYHTPLGHGFPGYALIDRARRLGIPNATHNNTRGHVTRLLEEELIREANAVAAGDRAGLQRVLASSDGRVLNRVLNLETGSLSLEAALKMILSRFYRSQEDSPVPEYTGRVPVILVMGTDEGGLDGNYHGTTVLAQAMRGMWPELRARLDGDAFLVRAVRPDDVEGLEAAFIEHERPPLKIAGFFHEIVMMNYGGRLLSDRFLRRAYALCRDYDVPTVADEIQSCLWAPSFFMYHEFGLQPSFVAVGKGFPGGEYPASRILFSSAMDTLPQFGALVTNGQEDLASLAYLITMIWARANSGTTRRIGEHYEERLRQLAARYQAIIAGTDGRRHLSAIRFRDLKLARAFAARLVERGLDASAQTYKSSCPPVVLTKLPLIAGSDVVEFVLERMEEAIRGL